MNFLVEQSKRLELIEAILKRYLPKETGEQKTVIEAMNYSVLAGGKRLRPMLMLESFRMFGGTDKVIEPFMAAIEMIHTYSLVHDDLPAMDNDEYRRGKKTTHAAYGEAMGILAGDGLLNYAFETACTAFSSVEEENGQKGLSEINAGYRRIAKALEILGKKAGIYGMIGGQTADIEAADRQIGEDLLDFIFELKTSALIEASMMIGAVLAGAPEKDVEKIEQAASKIGRAFQIQDDILDVTGSVAVLGKPVHSDEKNNKPTYVTMYGLSQAAKDVDTLSRQAMEILQTFEHRNLFLEELVLSLINRKK